MTTLHDVLQSATFDEVRHRTANAMLATPRARQIGTVDLQSHQSDAEARLHATLARHNGALLADDVGLGKTFVALAVAERYACTHIIAPAALLPMWRDAIRRTATAHVTLHSLHRVSQRADALPVEPASRPVLVIIDEAHHLRTPGTLRYQRVADFVVGHHVLLLSATPVHNSECELRALLALFLGSRANSIDPESLEQLVVRRQRAMVAGARIPDTVSRPPVVVPVDQDTLRGILTLPDPLPARHGTTAGALIRLGLLRAWCSSDGALSHSIRLRRLRGEAMAHALRSGRYPTHDDLRAWIVADSSVQLAFSELLVPESAGTAPLLDVLERHLDALATLQVEHAARARSDASRAEALRQLLRTEPDRPVVAFSQFTSTVRALYRALADIAGVASIAGREARIASGPLPRSDVLWRFAPTAHGRPPPAAHERVRLLLSTDLLAEGVNLQDAGTVVHLDLPWTDALRKQREGRCARIGSPFDVVHVITMAPPAPLDDVLRITRTLARKAGLATTLIGMSSPDARSAPEAASELRQLLTSWRNDTMRLATSLPDTELPDTDPSVVAFACGAVPGWMAVVESDGVSRMVAHHHDTTSDASRHIMALLERLAGPANALSSQDAAQAERTARHQLQEWIDSNETDFLSGPNQRAVSVAQRAMLAKLSELLAQVSAAERAQLAVAAAVAERVVHASRYIGAERALEVWLSFATEHAERVDTREWLRAWRRIPSLVQAGLAMTRMTRIDRHSSSRVTALMIIERSAP